MSSTKSSNAVARLFVFAAPSGAGKTTLVKAIVKQNPGLRFSISYTTRKQRSTEEGGQDYFFVTEDEFVKLRDEGGLLESALVFDHHYGTGRSQVNQHLQNGNPVILEIDWQGARQVRESMPDAVSIFILPPSVAELERRLRDRKTDSDDVITRRLRDALSDMQHWREFDYVIINEDLQTATSELAAVIAGRGAPNRVGEPALNAAVKQLLGS